MWCQAVSSHTWMLPASSPIDGRMKWYAQHPSLRSGTKNQTQFDSIWSQSSSGGTWKPSMWSVRDLGRNLVVDSIRHRSPRRLETTTVLSLESLMHSDWVRS